MTAVTTDGPPACLFIPDMRVEWSGWLANAFPVALAVRRPGWVVTRHVIAAAQMLWSALLIHLSEAEWRRSSVLERVEKVSA